MRFFTFREERGWAGSQAVVGFASKELVKSLVSIDELSEIFGGYLEYESRDGEQR